MTNRYMGLDFGEKCIGIALSDPGNSMAQPLETISRSNVKKDMAAIMGLIQKHAVAEIIIGLPLNMNGTMGDMAHKVLQFREKLQEKIQLPIHTWDERLSSVAAEKSLIEGGARRKKRKEVINHIAASLILQTWMDCKLRRKR